MPTVNELIKTLLKKGIKAEKVISRKKLFASLLSQNDCHMLSEKAKNKV
ncbi:hypothetical protein JOC77_002524 [Peribacillus deserti]|uniref:Fur-regulated basic protein FbpA n=1 Tax=Peribacillus deserti TaxID=673318 RepID=A0ABS2QJF3_9BACI|nr:hypothetical protein [Peribacillus deserti]MBM7693085.1 hypothetical protein [Peribacillus deserti]